MTPSALRKALRPTTIIQSVRLSRYLGLDLTIATETFQHTGSFKFRAAYNLALNIPETHIITASSGNFGHALAYACNLLGKSCTVVMPDTSARVKIDAVREFGAEVDLIDISKIGRSERVKELSTEYPEAYVASAYDDPWVIEGNASLGDELATFGFDVIIAPIGGGGLTSGILTGLRRSGSHTNLYAAEPLMANDASRSFWAGHIVRHQVEPQTIADGARTISLGERNFAILKDGLCGVIEVPEEMIKQGVRMLYSLANLKAEPTGALSLGALLTNLERFEGRRICCVVSGGNVDSEVYSQILMEC